MQPMAKCENGLETLRQVLTVTAQAMKKRFPIMGLHWAQTDEPVSVKHIEHVSPGTHRKQELQTGQH